MAVHCQICLSNICLRGVAKSDSADSGVVRPAGDVGLAAAEGAGARRSLRWNSENIIAPIEREGRYSLGADMKQHSWTWMSAWLRSADADLSVGKA
jgi:hypothetical protein